MKRTIELVESGAGALPDRAAAREPSALRCFALLTLTKACLALLGFHRTHQLVQRRSLIGRPAAQPARDAAEATAARVATAAAFFPGRALCLEQSLLLHFLLRRAGLQSTLRLGVQPYPFAAHAWVEHAGEPVNETRDGLRGFIPLPSLPGSRS